MPARRLRSRFHPLWLLTPLLLALLVMEWRMAGQVPVAPPVKGTSDPGKAKALDVPEFSFPAPQVFDDIAARPLFSKTRRPPEEGDAESPDTKPTKPTQLKRWQLSAVIMVDAERSALFRDALTRKSLKRREGESLEDWKVESVLEDRVTLSRGAEKQEIALRTYPEPPRRPPVVSKVVKPPAVSRTGASNARPRRVLRSTRTGVTPGLTRGIPKRP